MTREELKEQIMKLQTYKMHEGEDTVCVERDDVLKALEQQPCEDAPSAQPTQSIAEWQKDFREYINMLNIPRDDYKGIMEYIDELPVTSKQPCEGVISREEAQTAIEMSASRYTLAKEHGCMGQVEWSDQLIKVSDAVDIIRHLSSVTPQEPKQR